jgi:hypothetical protein
VKIARVDIDSEQGKILGQRLGVSGNNVPALKLLKTKEPPADALMDGLLKLKKLRKLIGTHLKGHKKNTDGMFLKVSRKAAEKPIEFDMHFYDILGVEKDAKTSQIRKAYRKLSLEFHPDKNPSFQEKFDLLTQASQTLMDTDLRLLYDLYGREYRNGQFNEYRHTRMKSQHAKAQLAQDADGIRIWKSKDGDELERGLKKHTILLAYQPWQASSIDAVQQWKKLPGLIGDLVDVGVVNCESETLCKEFGMGALPSIQLWPFNSSAIDTYDSKGENYDADNIANWAKANLIGSTLIEDLNKDNFEQKVINSMDPWLVVLCSYHNKFPACQKTKKTLNRLAYVLRPLGVRIGTAFCPETKEPDGIYLDEWCEVTMGVTRIGEEGPWNFPFVKVFKRGGDKLGGEIVNLNVRPPKYQGDQLVPDQVLEIIEKVMVVAAPEPKEEDAPEVDFDDEDPAENDL